MNELQRVTGLFAVATSSCHSMVILCWGYIFLSLDSYPLLWLHFPVTRQLPFLLWLYFPVIRQLPPPPPPSVFFCVCVLWLHFPVTWQLHFFAAATFSCHPTVTLFAVATFSCHPAAPPPPLLLLLWLHFPVTRQLPFFVVAVTTFSCHPAVSLRGGQARFWPLPECRAQLQAKVRPQPVFRCRVGLSVRKSRGAPLPAPPPPTHTHTSHIHTTSASRTHMWRSKRTPVAQQRAYS